MQDNRFNPENPLSPEEKALSDEERWNRDYHKRRDASFMLRHMPIRRRAINALIRAVLVGKVLLDPDAFRTVMSDSHYRKAFFNHKRRAGLLEGSLFQQTLYVPDGKQFDFKEAMAGRYAGYDHFRKSMIAKDECNVGTGRLMSLVDFRDVRFRQVDQYTPIGFADMLNIADLLNFHHPSIDDVVKNDLAVPTSYRAAFKKLGIYDQYATKLEVLGVAEKEIFMVTPKGNGVLYLASDGGEKKPLKDAQENPSWSMLPMPVRT